MFADIAQHSYISRQEKMEKDLVKHEEEHEPAVVTLQVNSWFMRFPA